MIDIETQVFDTVYPFIAGIVPTGGFVSEYVPKPAFLPHVYLAEIDNTPDGKTRDSGDREWSSAVTFEAQVYAQSKPECRRIMEQLDRAMVGLMGFSKLSGGYIPNLADQTVHRMVARYTAGVTRDGNLYKLT